MVSLENLEGGWLGCVHALDSSRMCVMLAGGIVLSLAARQHAVT